MKSLSDLNEMFSRSEDSLKAHFAEIRNNILLDMGKHHPKYDRGAGRRAFAGVQKDRKIRITKNHTQVITKFIRNSIQNRAPDGACFPRNEKEINDQKSAELNESVYQYLKGENDLPSVYAKIIFDFVVSGETYTKVFYDPMAGKFLGYEEGEDGEKVARFSGAIVHERVAAYNYLTDPDADSDRNNSWGCVRKYLSRKKLSERYLGDEARQKIIKDSSKEKTNWFDGYTASYSDAGADEVELREFYFKPCQEYPEGYFIFATDAGILEEGELPDGFCIFGDVFDDSPESPRGYGPIKQIRPFQMEVNRCAAAMITESIILGHSTVLYQTGDKPTTTAIGNGIKGLEFHGMTAPTVLPGQTGGQYLDYMEKTIEEMYRVSLVPQQDEDKQLIGSGDAQAMLGRALRDKMRFSIYGEKIENLICKIIDYTLKLARRYLSEDTIIPIVGQTEAVNISEFKNTNPLSYQIRIQPRSDDFTTVYGKSIQITQALQYVGSQLPPEAIASMIRELPFLNKENILKDYTVWKDQADAVIMAMNRGQIPFFFERSKHDYMVDRLQMRMNENDFPMLSQQIQMNYAERLDAHEQMLMKQQQEAAHATAGYLPSGGGLVSVDYYVVDENGKEKRARLPYESVKWLIDRLREQGSDVEKITNLPTAVQADLGQMNQQAGVDVNQQAAPPQGSMPMAG